jgi:hypothetical protein
LAAAAVMPPTAKAATAARLASFAARESTGISEGPFATDGASSTSATTVLNAPARSSHRAGRRNAPSGRPARSSRTVRRPVVGHALGTSPDALGSLHMSPDGALGVRGSTFTSRRGPASCDRASTTSRCWPRREERNGADVHRGPTRPAPTPSPLVPRPERRVSSRWHYAQAVEAHLQPRERNNRRCGWPLSHSFRVRCGSYFGNAMAKLAVDSGIGLRTRRHPDGVVATAGAVPAPCQGTQNRARPRTVEETARASPPDLRESSPANVTEGPEAVSVATRGSQLRDPNQIDRPDV